MYVAIYIDEPANYGISKSSRAAILRVVSNVGILGLGIGGMTTESPPESGCAWRRENGTGARCESKKTQTRCERKAGAKCEAECMRDVSPRAQDICGSTQLWGTGCRQQVTCEVVRNRKETRSRKGRDAAKSKTAEARHSK